MFAPGGCILINGRWLRYQITRWVSDSDVTQTRMRLGCRVGIGGAAAHLFSPRTMRIRRGSTRKSRSSIIAGSMQEQSCGREELTSPAPLSLVARARQSQAVPATDSDGTQIFDNFDVAFTVARSPNSSPRSVSPRIHPSQASRSPPFPRARGRAPQSRGAASRVDGRPRTRGSKPSTWGTGRGGTGRGWRGLRPSFSALALTLAAMYFAPCLARAARTADFFGGACAAALRLLVLALLQRRVHT